MPGAEDGCGLGGSGGGGGGGARDGAQGFSDRHEVHPTAFPAAAEPAGGSTTRSCARPGPAVSARPRAVYPTVSGSRVRWADDHGRAEPPPEPLGGHPRLRRRPGDRARGERRDRRRARQHHREPAVREPRHRTLLHARAGRVARGPRRVRGGARAGRRALEHGAAPRRGRPPAAHPRARVDRRPLRERPAVPPARGAAARRDPARALEPRHPARPRRLLPGAVRVARDHGCRGEARIRAARARGGRGARHRARRAGPLHADPHPRALRRPRRTLHQHPPLVPPGLQGREPLPAGARPRREAHRRDGALRHERPRRGPDHRAERRAGRPLALGRRARRDRPGRGEPHALPGGQVVRRAPRALDGARTIIFR